MSYERKIDPAKIIEANKAIAKYHRLKYDDTLLYHKSWELLMPVVCKILKENKYHILISTQVVSIYPNLKMDSFVAHDHSVSFIKNIWLVVAEYCLGLIKKKKHTAPLTPFPK